MAITQKQTVPFVVRGEGTGVAQTITVGGDGAAHVFRTDTVPPFGGPAGLPSDAVRVTVWPASENTAAAAPTAAVTGAGATVSVCRTAPAAKSGFPAWAASTTPPTTLPWKDSASRAP